MYFFDQKNERKRCFVKENKPKGARKVLISKSQYSSSDRHEVSVAAKFQKALQ